MVVPQTDATDHLSTSCAWIVSSQADLTTGWDTNGDRSMVVKAIMCSGNSSLPPSSCFALCFGSLFSLLVAPAWLVFLFVIVY
jgi:hypothetical protein